VESVVVDHDESAIARVSLLDIKSMNLIWKGDSPEPSSSPAVIIVPPEERFSIPSSLVADKVPSPRFLYGLTVFFLILFCVRIFELISLR